MGETNLPVYPLGRVFPLEGKVRLKSKCPIKFGITGPPSEPKLVNPKSPVQLKGQPGINQLGNHPTAPELVQSPRTQVLVNGGSSKDPNHQEGFF